MHFDLSDDQRALVDGIRNLCGRRFPVDAVQQLEGRGCFDAQGWSALEDAGVFVLRRAEVDGGVGMGMTEAALVYAELGRALVPGPLIGTQLCVGLGLVGGPAGIIVAGRRPIVLAFPDVVEAVVVVSDDELRLVQAGDLVVQPVDRPLDPLTPLAVVEHIPPGEAVGGASAARRLRNEGAVLAAALLLGIAEALTERSTTYAKQREQFGRPIGGFQAVKHLLADMVVRTEVARAAVYAAAVHLDDPAVGDVQRAVSTAKLLAGQNAIANGKAAVQIHGGMGFTWEVPIHLYLKRAALLDVAFGSVDEHAEAMAASL